jgi:hypothetical protein
MGLIYCSNEIGATISHLQSKSPMPNAKIKKVEQNAG